MAEAGVYAAKTSRRPCRESQGASMPKKGVGVHAYKGDADRFLDKRRRRAAKTVRVPFTAWMLPAARLPFCSDDQRGSGKFPLSGFLNEKVVEKNRRAQMNARTIFGLAGVVCTLAFPLRSEAQQPEVADTENKAELKIKDRSWGTDIQRIRCIALSPDNKKVLIAPSKSCCGFDSGDVQQWDKLRVWDLAQQKEILTLTGHKTPVGAVAFSGDGKKAAAVEEGDYIAQEPRPGLGHGNGDTFQSVRSRG